MIVPVRFLRSRCRRNVLSSLAALTAIYLDLELSIPDLARLPALMDKGVGLWDLVIYSRARRKQVWALHSLVMGTDRTWLRVWGTYPVSTDLTCAHEYFNCEGFISNPTFSASFTSNLSHLDHLVHNNFTNHPLTWYRDQDRNGTQPTRSIYSLSGSYSSLGAAMDSSHVGADGVQVSSNLVRR